MADKPSPTISDAATRLRDDLGDLGAALASQRDGLLRLVRERPLAACAVALGAGFVLAGGLFTRSTARLIAFGTRLGGPALVRGLFSQIATR